MKNDLADIIQKLPGKIQLDLVFVREELRW